MMAGNLSASDLLTFDARTQRAARTDASTTMGTVNVGIIGLGFMGRTHLAAYQAAREAGLDVRVVGIADRRFAEVWSDPSLAAGGARGEGGGGNFETGASRDKLFDPSEVTTYADDAALLADERFDLVSVCTPTDTHVDVATRALEAGKHVLCEKPVSLRAAEIARLAQTARDADRLCMPAMCMRFWPGWSWLKDRVVDGSLGSVKSATFQRLGSAPDWGTDFYGDTSRSGGALMDLHIHDTDFICWLFGGGGTVGGAGVRGVVSRGGLAHGTTLYNVGPQGGSGIRPHVMAEWGQDHHPGFGFRMRFVVVFDHATADFDLARTPALLLHRGGASEAVALPEGTGYDYEVRHLIDAIHLGLKSGEMRATLDDAIAVANVLEMERASLGESRE